jgi:3-methyladenine DNA glycosylase Tag
LEAPKRVKPKRLNDYLEVMSKAVFQSGISWGVVEAKWPGFKEALFDFDPERIAHLSPKEVDALAADTRIIRNRKKIEATVANAATMLDLQDEFGSFKKYLRSQGGFDQTMADIKKRFKFMGDMGTYVFLYVVGEEVPPHEHVIAGRAAKPGRTRVRTARR